MFNLIPLGTPFDGGFVHRKDLGVGHARLGHANARDATVKPFPITKTAADSQVATAAVSRPRVDVRVVLVIFRLGSPDNPLLAARVHDGEGSHSTAFHLRPNKLKLPAWPFRTTEAVATAPLVVSNPILSAVVAVSKAVRSTAISVAVVHYVVDSASLPGWLCPSEDG